MKLHLWGFVSGQIEMPEQLRFTSLNDMEYPECMTLECELSKWRQLDNEAIKLITNTLPGWMANLLSPEQRATSKALFDELQARYGKHDDDETMEDWLDLFWDGSADMSDFLDEWTKRLAKCLEAGIVISEVWQIYQLAWSVKGARNAEVNTWASQVLRDLEEDKVSPLHVLLAELISITEEEA